MALAQSLGKFCKKKQMIDVVKRYKVGAWKQTVVIKCRLLVLGRFCALEVGHYAIEGRCLWVNKKILAGIFLKNRHFYFLLKFTFSPKWCDVPARL